MPLFEPVFQPIVGLSDSSVLCYEALARLGDTAVSLTHWEFLAEAERLGFAYLIDLQMLGQVGQIMQASQSVFSVNLSLSTACFHGQQVIDLLSGELAHCAQRLILEITDTFAMREDLTAALTVFAAQARAMGVRLALDSTTENSAATASQRFASPTLFDFLKFPYSDAPNSSALRDRYSHFRNVQYVVKHIDSAAKLSSVRSAGVANAQGFYFAHPLPWGSFDPDTPYRRSHTLSRVVRGD